ncbi:MAG: hypothetical protein IMZ61_03160 [Planctomycetes bacterium]|nr:hypothetical protein [Planctomycetota bacterium]
MAKKKEDFTAEKMITCLIGYITWAIDNGKGSSEINSNVIHDLAGWKKDHKEAWFSPRTSGYEKHCRI